MKQYEKWRELDIDPFSVKFKNIKINTIESYLPAGNDVIECNCKINSTHKNVFIKFERIKMADFETEIKHLDILEKHYSYDKIPKIIEEGFFKEKRYIVLDKIVGDRLSDIFQNSNMETKAKYLIKYGEELATIHDIPAIKFFFAKQRKINDYPTKEAYKEFDKLILPYIEYLQKNKPNINKNTFIHGDFHYANILWNNEEVSGVLDFEYSGKGYKEQDIAWACILRPAQYFMDTKEDILYFLKGYISKGNFKKENFKWCLINGICHFYLMNINNLEYKEKLLNLLSDIMKEDFNLEYI